MIDLLFMREEKNTDYLYGKYRGVFPQFLEITLQWFAEMSLQ